MNKHVRVTSLLIACVLLIYSIMAIQVAAVTHEGGLYLGNSEALSGYVIPDHEQSTRVVKFPVSFGDEGSTYYLVE